ncbi:MAG: hypothetical protein O8C66_13615 [Candidatus Methanoperedens sp.]|nr:hypothetical protein [Candidatus Methanoperedens sp.]MCZ7371536.1 hypothetical protein [Candidatus Methanoperedens sp.]
MGYAVIMFGVLLIMSVVMGIAVNYGIAKDSQVAPLKAENDYAAREAGKAQTALTIVQTCIQTQSGDGRYVDAHGNDLSEQYFFNLTVRNNGSIVLNSSKPTVIYLSRKTSNNIYNSSKIGFPRTPGNVWAPRTNASLNISDITINTPDVGFGGCTDNSCYSKNPWDELRILVAAENGVIVIPPTSPINFTGIVGTNTSKINLSWNASYDVDGIAYYRIYAFEDDGGNDFPNDFCPPRAISITQIPANATFYSYNRPIYINDITIYYLTAVDNLGNEGVPSRTIDCHTTSGFVCKNK